MKQHFVVFRSPGTFFHEESQMPIDFWNPAVAAEMARGVKERYGATPFGFYFITRERGPEDLDSKETAKSSMFYLGGKIETLAEIEARALPDEEILLSNMQMNDWDRVIVNTNSWKIVQPLREGDTVLDWVPDPVAIES